ncbi:MAG: amino acid permease [Vicinamibacterales bacterium]|jgi:amino acid transporter|nr:amino acid transporter [Acidobacteriota bacterium]MDP7471450.1 amino acid permease [Vicinamibacterales bacterium]MDP7671658.1 amino acid permease [Vicinamibacterales bacterium]HJO37010.1 amino acid permease [Vicinamibacterales bacterium]|tara:strand:+ start:569 stop:1915 length:1347 start_codon:yes stop_codon:yes gene_type:complete
MTNPVTLRRALGRWDLTAIGINQVIGSGIFLLPSAVTQQVGTWAVLAFVFAGLASLLVALCFAEAGSRFEVTGGPYVYARAAFGRLVGFEVGWMQWVTRLTSWAGVANGIPLALGFYFPAMATGLPHTLFILGLFGALAGINLLGVRQGAWAVNFFTVSKLLPLGLFILVGLFFVQPEPFTTYPSVSWAEGSTAGLLLIFAFGGFDVVPVPAGEASNPRGQVPFAMITTIAAVTGFMLLAQVVTMGTLPGLNDSATPLADAAFVFMGAGGALMIGIGSVISMTGNNAGQVLTSSRMLFALAEHGELPARIADVHPRYRTPHVAILVSTGIAVALALSGSFVALATASAVARLVTYTGVAAATLRLRRPDYEGRVQPPTFRTPLGASVPVLAIVVSLIILVGASSEQLIGGATALALGAIVFFLNDRVTGGPARRQSVSHEASVGLERV